MYDRFIERLSKSEYKDNFILKGGFYLSVLFGINNRSTMDIDTAITKTKFTTKNIIKMIEEIININIEDRVILKIDKTELIRTDDEYGGLRITLIFNLDEYSDRFHIDVATGDPIHPGPNDYGYKSLIENKTYNVWAYNVETILAEKIETILSKLENSSRMKDYYDIYLIYNNEFNKLNINNFKKAVEKTFTKRKFTNNLQKSLSIIKNSKTLPKYWNSYSKKNKFANNVSFNDTIKCLEQFITIINSK